MRTLSRRRRWRRALVYETAPGVFTGALRLFPAQGASIGSAAILLPSPVMVPTLKDRGDGSSCEVLYKVASLCPALFQGAVLERRG